MLYRFCTGVALWLGCMIGVFLTAPTAAGGELKTGFREIHFLYDFAPETTASLFSLGRNASPRLVVTIDDWHGYYDQYMGCYHVFPARETIPTPEIVSQFKQMLSLGVADVKDKMDVKRSGTINFGGIRFKGALIDFRFVGRIEDPRAALAIMTSDQIATITQQSANTTLEAPLPRGAMKPWRISLHYPGGVVESNASEHDTGARLLSWSNTETSATILRVVLDQPLRKIE